MSHVSLFLMMLISIVNAVSSDCANIVNMASDLNFAGRQPSKWTAIQSDCCASNTGITCYMVQSAIRVIAIQWGNFGLAGTVNPNNLPYYLTLLDLSGNSITGAFPSPIPQYVSQLLMSNNQFTGSIPALPSGLTILWIDNNLLTGAIPTSWPNGLTSLKLSHNSLTGDISTLPSTLTLLYLGYTSAFIPPTYYFTGTLTLSQPQYLIIYGNQITDLVISITNSLTQ